ncbi:MAG: cyclic nucleotide-binding/CBS domain-containing protein [Gammaproteobacteria bacterium]|nr:cyclic nucleotide-binding/CBS domain-containing protein [Gammaproteobacteria bacterium]
MEIELQEIADFIAAIPPFDRLPGAVINQITRKISIRYLRRGGDLPPDNTKEPLLYILRTGAVSLFSSQERLLGKLGEGDICTFFCMEDEHHHFVVRVDEDTLIYTLSCKTVQTLLAEYPDELAYFHKTASHRLNQTVSEMQLNSSISSTLLQTPIRNIMHTPVITADSSITIREAAQLMAEKRVSSLILLQADKPVGILTDKDIAKRCVATGLTRNTAVSEIMTSTIITVGSHTDAFEAMMKMTRKHIHHLAVIDNGQLNGIISVSDLMQLEGRNSVYITNAIRKAKSIEALEEQSRTLPQLQRQLVQMGVPVNRISEMLTAVSSAITRRLCKLAEEALGDAPVPYAWVAAGSHARREQSGHSDQDNALIIDDRMLPEHQPYFTNLAKFICDGLARCGFVYCPGDVMAINPRWRQTSQVWGDYFHNWITTPSPKALMYCSIFFDLRTIYGDETILQHLRQEMLQLTPKNELFLAHLTHNALKLKPPLGFFRDFVLVHDGKHNDTLDLKHNGLAPIVDLARIYALAEGVEAVSTLERLNSVAGSRALSSNGAENLRDAFEFINTLRMRHQAQQISDGKIPDNYLSPSDISKLERAHLKDAFKVIQTLQSYIESRYRV